MLEKKGDEFGFDLTSTISFAQIAQSGLPAGGRGFTAKLFLRLGPLELRCPRCAGVARIEIGPRQHDGERGKHQDNPGNDDGGFCRHGYSALLGSGPMVMVRPHR